MKTFQPKEKEVKRAWHLVDAKGQILGRMATQIATYLTGKHKPEYSTHMDSGDYVVVINAGKFELTGRKKEQKVYRSHSGYPGGFKEISFSQMMEKDPGRVVEHAVSGMLPDNRLKKVRMTRLKIVEGNENPFSDKFPKEDK